MLTVLHFGHGRMDPATSVQKRQRVLFVLSVVESAVVVQTVTGSGLTLAPRLRAILPRQMVVFVRIPGCSSFEVFARYFSSAPFIVRSESLVMMVRIDLTVCSRTNGATSVKPDT